MIRRRFCSSRVSYSAVKCDQMMGSEATFDDIEQDEQREDERNLCGELGELSQNPQECASDGSHGLYVA